MKIKPKKSGLASKIQCSSVFLIILFSSLVYAKTHGELNIKTLADSVLSDSSNIPLLKLNSGLTATISQMDLNIKLKLLAVGMQNNQVLLWSLDKHTAPRIFSTPVLDEQSKRSHPVALDPQGRWIAYAVPGSKNDIDNESKIYLFDLATAKVIKLLDQLESRAQSIRFSPDGNYLAASLSKGYGLKIWSTQSWKLLQQVDPVRQIPRADHAKLKLNDANHPGLAFNPNKLGRVGVVMVGDSGIWCFGKAPDFKKEACLEQSPEVWIAADEAYNSVAFSPDGNRIAIGSRRTGRILILSLINSKKPSILVPPKSNHKYNKFQYLSEVAWSLNGRYIYAGGVFWLANPDSGILQNGIVRWDLQSNNQTKTFPAGTDTVMDIVPLGSEGILYATQDPVIDALNITNETGIDNQLLPIQSGNLNLRYWKEKNILASKNGQTITFKPFGEKRFIQFDLVNRNVSYIDHFNFETSPIYQGSDSVLLENIINIPATPTDDRKPSLNGKPLSMEVSEISRDYAFLPSMTEFIWLTSNAISYVQSDGTKKWTKKLKQEGFRVILANEGRLTIVAYSDGTIRWYLTQTGQQLLTLFIARLLAPTEVNTLSINWKWVAWTPEGFYSSSAAGEQLIGWLINDPADSHNPIYYDFGTFRGKFYRPDVVEQILKVHDGQLAFSIANEKAGLNKDEKIEDMLTSLINMAPPSIDILSPLDSEILHPGLIDICFKLRSPAKIANPPKEVNIFLFAGLIESLKNNLEFNKRICQKINIPQALHIEKGALSIKLSVEGTALSLRGVQQDTRSLLYESRISAQKSPRLLGLFVGISDYDQSSLKLEYAEKDAEDMERFWNKQQGHPYREIDIKRIPGSEATRDNILAGLEQLQNQAKADDFVILFFAGHGATLLGKNQYLFFSRTADTSDTDKLLANSVTDLDLNNALKNMKARFKIVILDTCRNTLSSTNPRIQRVDSTALRKEVIDFWNAHAFFSTGEKGFALERNGNGIYTAALLEGLKGDADLPPIKDKAISITEIGHYTFLMVNDQTNGSQQPIVVTPDNLEAFKNKPPIVTLN